MQLIFFILFNFKLRSTWFSMYSSLEKYNVIALIVRSFKLLHFQIFYTIHFILKKVMFCRHVTLSQCVRLIVGYVLYSTFYYVYSLKLKVDRNSFCHFSRSIIFLWHIYSKTDYLQKMNFLSIKREQRLKFVTRN